MLNLVDLFYILTSIRLAFLVYNVLSLFKSRRALIALLFPNVQVLWRQSNGNATTDFQHMLHVKAIL